MKHFLLDKVSNKSTGYEILVCEIIDYCYDFRGALEPYRNKSITHHQLPHCFHFRMADHAGVSLNFCCMKYKFVSTFPIQPPQPDPSTTYKELSEIVIPYLASVGGIKRFAKAFNYGVNLFENEEDDKILCQKLQRLLTADKYPNDIVNLLNMFELDSMKLFLQRYANNDGLIESGSTAMQFKSNITISKFDQLDFKILESYTNKKLSKFESDSGVELVDLGKNVTICSFLISMNYFFTVIK